MPSKSGRLLSRDWQHWLVGKAGQVLASVDTAEVKLLLSCVHHRGSHGVVEFKLDQPNTCRGEVLLVATADERQGQIQAGGSSSSSRSGGVWWHMKLCLRVAVIQLDVGAAT